MSIVVIILLGLFIGWLVAALREVDEGVFASMAFGVTGALLGSALSYLVMRHHHDVSMLAWGTLVWSAFGALLISTVAARIVNPNKNNGV